MNRNYVLWIVGAIIVVGIGYVLLMQGPAAAPTTTDTTPVTDTGDTGGTTVGTTAGKPVVTTTEFASVSSTTAVVVGTVIPNGAETTYWFEYGPTLSFGLAANVIHVSASYKVLGAAAYITGLKPSSTYYFRIGAKNAYGTVYGGPYNFITAAK
jgi:hypothetical protein